MPVTDYEDLEDENYMTKEQIQEMMNDAFEEYTQGMNRVLIKRTVLMIVIIALCIYFFGKSL